MKCFTERFSAMIGAVMAIAPVLLFCCLMGTGVLAVPADPDSRVTITQPDGLTEIILRPVGDERNGRLATEDGYTVVRDQNGWYQYAVLDGDGNLVPSGRNARPVQQRSAADQAFLSGIETSLSAVSGEFESGPEPSPGEEEFNPDLVMRGANTVNNVLLILIKFPDVSNTYPASDFGDLINLEGFDGVGSLNDYYDEVSYGQFGVSGTTTIWYTAANNHSYYAYDDGNGWTEAAQLAREAIVAAVNAGVDFSPYDNDGNGYVDGLFIVHAGPGAEAGYYEYPWSHSWSLTSAGLSSVNSNGVTINAYTMEPEKYSSTARSTIGVFCHEYGHAIGLPDLYDTDGSSIGVGKWCLMGSGSWNGPFPGRGPAHLSAWCKDRLGWLDAENITVDRHGFTVADVETSPTVYRLYTMGDIGNEYFLVEYRRKILFDAYLPACGLAIWHIDDNVGGNSNDSHRKVDLEEADNNELVSYQAGDLWLNKTFNGTSVPNSNNYAGTATQVEVVVYSSSCLEGGLATDLVVGNNLQLVQTTPSNGAQNVSAYTSVSARFNLPMDETTFNSSTFLVSGSVTGVHSGTISYNSGTYTATFDPSGVFLGGETVTATLTTGVKSAAGGSMAGDYSWTFSIYQATTRYVPSQYSNIQAAINASSDGDVVMVAPGTYTGYGNTNVSFLGKAVTVRSSSGAAVTTIDCGGPDSDNRAFVFNNGETSASRLIGFTIQNGDVRTRQENFINDRNGGAIKMQSASPTIQDCVFKGCQAFLGGAIHCMKILGEPDDVYPTITGCVFENNSANDGSPNTDNNGGAILFINSHPTVTNCAFIDNHSSSYGGGVYMSACTGSFEQCTFAANGSIHGGGFCLVSTGITLAHTIVANSSSGCGIKSFNGTTISFECNDFWNNAGGSLAVDIDSTDVDLNTIFLDPLFCDSDEGDYELAENSPCAATASPCLELIGKYDVGCGPIRPIIWVETTWGDDNTGTGSQDSPFKTIGKGISQAIDDDSVFVGPGIYTENINFAGKKIVVHGYLGPEVTILQPANPSQYTITMTGGEPAGTQFSGFTVTKGGDTYTVMINGGGQPLIKNNVFDYNIQGVPGNNKTVIRTDYSNPTITGNLFIHNGGISCVGIYYGTGTITYNTFDDNNRGILTITGQGIARNNIITNSDTYGIYGTWTELDYNNVWNNNPNYLGGPGPGANDISADPLYIDAAVDRYLIENTSPCVGAGEAGYDMGCYQIRYVPAQYVTIQDAINAADDGDILLVYSGYYFENLDFLGKGIKMISRAGQSDPEATVIWTANSASSTVNIQGGAHQTMQITGFTFWMGGNAHMIKIFDEAYALISDNIFQWNLVEDFEENNVIIYSSESRPYVTRNLFSDNSGLACLGIYSGHGQVINNTFNYNNRGFFTISGRGIARNNIVTYSNYYGIHGNWKDLDYNDVWENWPNYNTGTTPGLHDISENPLFNEDYTLQESSPCIDAGHPDLFYKDPDQSRNDMGAYPTTHTWALVNVPYDASTIQAGINLVQNGGEVHVAPGVYQENINFAGKTIRVIGAGNTPTGDTTFLKPAVANSPTVLITSGEGAGTELSGFAIINGGDTYTVTIGNNASPLIANNVFRDNIICGTIYDPEDEILQKLVVPEEEAVSEEPGGDIYVPDCGYNKVIIKCQAPSGTPVIKNNLFYDNGGISCIGIWTDAYAEIINNTFDNNPRGFLTISTQGGVALNNIVTNSDDYGIYGTWTVIDYNDVWNNNPNYLGGIPGANDISADPLFADAAHGLYFLSTGSPCIDAGHPDAQYNDPDGSRNDMGAFPYDASLLLAKEQSPLPVAYALDQNRPNPFNPTTSIRFALPEATQVVLDIINILGQRVATLVDGYRGAGIHDVIWDGMDEDGRAVASGIYLYRIRTASFIETKKMMLLK